MTRRLVEIDTLADFDAHSRTAARMSGWVVQSVDLTGRSADGAADSSTDADAASKSDSTSESDSLPAQEGALR